MDQDRARSLLTAERDEVQGLLKDAEEAGQEDRLAEVDSEAGDIADAAQPLYAALTDDQKWRLHALLRAIHMHHGLEMGMMRQGGESGWRPGEQRRAGEGEWRQRREGGRDEEDMPSHDQSEDD